MTGARFIRTPKLAPTLRGYRRGWLSHDALAAAALLAISLPGQIATSRLAGMPPTAGLYAFITGAVVFALLGSSPRLSVAADSTIAPLFAVGLASFAATGTGHYHNLVALLAVVTGAILVCVWLLRLGWLAELLSEPIIVGFLAGIAVVIIVDQLPDLLGIPTGGISTLARLSHVAHSLDAVKPWAIVVGLSVFTFVFTAQRVARRLPGPLIALLVATALVWAFGLDHHGVAVVGTIGSAAPRFSLRGISLHALGQVAPVAFIVVVVTISQTAATARAFAPPPGSDPSFEIDVAADFMAVGMGDVVAGLIGAFPLDASPPSSAAIAEAGGHTQMTNLLAAAVVIALLPAAGLLHVVPVAALAGILVFIATRIVRVHDLRAIARFSKVEMALALITLLAVDVIGVEQGIAVAVVLAILERTRISVQPKLHVLGRLPGTTSWAPLSTAEAARPVDGVLAVVFATPLWYANSTRFYRELLYALEHRSPTRPRALVLDARGLTDIDYTGVTSLATVLDELDREGISFGIARASRRMKEGLERAGLMPDRIPRSMLFPTVEAAVVALAPASEPGHDLDAGRRRGRSPKLAASGPPTAQSAQSVTVPPDAADE
ncbi:MAG: SulP family inorganic anion transporter [Solirubrobacteraceae bacterium]